MVRNRTLSAKEVISDFKENYSRVRKLLDEESKNDPENEPYLSQYKAKEILNNMRDSLLLVNAIDSSVDAHKLDAMMGVILMNIGIIDMETDELSSSEKAFVDAEDVLVAHSLNPEIVITLLTVYNNLGILWSNRDEPEKGKIYLLKAKELYENFKCTMQMPLPFESMLGIEDEETGIDEFVVLEKAHTLTLYYLAQIYGSLKENLKSAVYCHITLKRQIEYNDYEHIDWALNCATLSQFFAEQNGFYQSRHHLAAASTILDQYRETLVSTDITDEVYQAKLETFNHRSADVARCWVKYCLLLLSNSRLRLMTENDELPDPITDLSNLTLEDSENICDGDIKSLVFTNLDVSKYESQVTDKFILTYEDAREVFLSCQNWLNKAKEYYKPDTLASDYIELVQDGSQSYTYLAFFEEDDERRSKMLKRRITMIEDLLLQVNPTYYLHYCRQLWFELGEVYSDILGIKFDRLNKTKEKPNPNALKKINFLCEKSIENYDKFLTSLKTANGKFPDKLDAELIKPVICALAFIGKTSMKRIGLNKKMQLDHFKKSYECYKDVVDICSHDEEAANLMGEEYSLCQEMANILPLKIKKMESELMTS